MAGATQIGVAWTALTTAQNGGSPILGYQIWRDNGLGGDFKALFDDNGVMAVSFLDTGLVNSRTYRYKLRARNINGWSDFGDVAYLVAASKPPKPPAPVLSSVSTSPLTFTFDLAPPTDSGGSKILDYQLYIDGGSLNSAFVSVGGGSGSSAQVQLSQAGQGLTPGSTYRVRWTVRSAFGYSDPSDSLRFGFGSPAEAPTNLVLDIANSGPGRIAVSWDKANDGELPIQGYTLQMRGSSFTTLYDGSADPDTTSFVVSGLPPGEYFEFRVLSHNFNGQSSSSNVLGAYA